MAHIVADAQGGPPTFENLIALCPTCHTRYDAGREIDRPSMRLYKARLSLGNGRFSDVERRVLQRFLDDCAFRRT